jgi:galactokinase
VYALARDHRLTRGITGVISGEMPIGGLSSSAAVILAYLLALAWVNELTVSQQQMVMLARRAENQYVGLASGILDQSVILYSRAAHLTAVDCSTGNVECLPRAEGSPDLDILVVHSGVSRALVASGYNDRVSECREAAHRLLVAAGCEPEPDARLSQVEPELFTAEGPSLPANLRRRAAHYFSEVRRVDAGIAAWRAGDMARFGKLVSASGASSIHSYECGSPHLLTLYQLLRQAPGVYGARFSGGGFGGSCIALVDPDAIAEVSKQVQAQYSRAHPEQADRFSIHLCRSSEGARMLDMEL